MIRWLHETRWILFTAACYYAVVLPRFYVGYWSDDARDILAAHSLGSGHYLNWQLPGHPATNFPLPGFPLVLAPLTLFFFHHPGLLRCIPYLLTLACLPLLNALAAPWLRGRARACLLILFALNPTTLVVSGRVTADACFMAVTLAAFVMFYHALQNQGKGMAWTGVCVGLAAIVRPEGVLLLPAMVIALLLSRARRGIGPLVLFGAGPLIIVWARNYGVTGEISGYTSIWRDSLPLLAGHYAPLLKNAAMELGMLCAGLLGGWDFNLLLIPFWVWIYTGVAMFLMARGFYALTRAAPQETAVITVGLIYTAEFFLLHALWLAMDPHYLWPLLPFALFLGVKGFERSEQRRIALCGGVLMLCLLGCALYQYAGAIRDTMHKPYRAQFPQDTLEWIARATPQNSFFLTPNAPLLSLYTQRFATAFLEAHNEDEFRYRLLEKGVTHVLLRSPGFLYVQTAAGRNPNEIWAQVPIWIASDPLHFSPLYENAAEDSRIYAVASDPEFFIAFKLYLQARDAINQGRPAEAITTLQTSFHHARLPGALNAYATICLFDGKNLKEAQADLEEALARRPQFALAALNLARVYKRTHQPAAARHYFDAARTMSRANADNGFLIPVIDREEQEM